VFLQTLIVTMGDKLLPCIEYLSNEHNELFAAELQRSPDVVAEFLRAILMLDADECSNDAAVMFFNVLGLLLPQEASARNVVALSRVAKSLISKEPEPTKQRFAEAIFSVVRIFCTNFAEFCLKLNN
jgi:hypothetical protein